ncbi:hypothetical protein HMPREF1144_6036 [Klebsiella sp. OBRC7]|nr:hypothetical protein HMPREF1144_6036 [Klebsiella sp. OBRC7]ESA62869.1 hypothetical protein HMPREF1591_03509 [Escherichia coli 113303]
MLIVFVKSKGIVATVKIMRREVVISNDWLIDLEHEKFRYIPLLFF